MGTIFTPDALNLELANNQTGNATPGTAVLDNALVGLLNSDTLALGKTTTLAQCIANEGGYPGYARKLITWNAASISDDGTVEAVGIVPEFRPSGASTVNMYGMFIASSDSLALLGVGPLDDAPLPMIGTTSAIVLTVRWRPQSGGETLDVS